MELADWLTTPQAARLIATRVPGMTSGRLERLRRSGFAPEHERTDGAWGRIRWLRESVEAWEPPDVEPKLLMKPSRAKYW